MTLLSNPLSVFLINILLAGLLYCTGRWLAGPSISSPVKSSTYSSGEAPPTELAAPGYRPFFVLALFFAILHLGVLILGIGSSSVLVQIYLVGIFLALLALILG
ncbi:MAG: hypothetical protein E4G99_11760 [Anaerolineales bacterium]|nr:MAG: hypothetical protein E4G99_11760 [Anaerolineales bacterium]